MIISIQVHVLLRKIFTLILVTSVLILPLRGVAAAEIVISSEEVTGPLIESVVSDVHNVENESSATSSIITDTLNEDLTDSSVSAEIISTDNNLASSSEEIPNPTINSDEHIEITETSPIYDEELIIGTTFERTKIEPVSPPLPSDLAVQPRLKSPAIVKKYSITERPAITPDRVIIMTEDIPAAAISSEAVATSTEEVEVVAPVLESGTAGTSTISSEDAQQNDEVFEVASTTDSVSTTTPNPTSITPEKDIREIPENDNGDIPSPNTNESSVVLPKPEEFTDELVPVKGESQ